MANTWMSPKSFLGLNKIKVEAGMILDPDELGMPEHPQYGKLLTIEVIEAKADGSIFLLGQATCPMCGEAFHPHPGDWFQKRACNVCAKKGRRPSAKMSEEEKEAKKAERTAKYAAERVVKEQAKAEEAAKRAQKAAEEAQAKVEALKKAAAERADLIAKVAAEKGVAVSPQAAS